MSPYCCPVIGLVGAALACVFVVEARVALPASLPSSSSRLQVPDPPCTLARDIPKSSSTCSNSSHSLGCHTTLRAVSEWGVNSRIFWGEGACLEGIERGLSHDLTADTAFSAAWFARRCWELLEGQCTGMFGYPCRQGTCQNVC